MHEFSKESKGIEYGWRPSLVSLDAIAFRLEAIASRLEDINFRVKDIASRLEDIAFRVEAIAFRLETIARTSYVFVYGHFLDQPQAWLVALVSHLRVQSVRRGCQLR